MAKAASPIRLQEELMQAASVTAKRFHRSTAEQIEYWADMGRKVATILDPDDLLSISTGLATIKLDPIHSSPVDPADVFQLLEDERTHDTLSQTVTSSSIKYQVSSAHPGYLERVDQDGKIMTGTFENGEFIAMIETVS